MELFFTGFNCSSLNFLRGPQRHERVWRSFPGRVDCRRVSQALGYLCWTSGENLWNYPYRYIRLTSVSLVQISIHLCIFHFVCHSCLTSHRIANVSSFPNVFTGIFAAVYISDFCLEYSFSLIFSLDVLNLKFQSLFSRNPYLEAFTRKITSVVTFVWRTLSFNTSTLNPFSTLLCVTLTTINAMSFWWARPNRSVD